VPEGTALLASFGHMYGGYDAGYYSYAWSDAIAAYFASAFRQSEHGFTDSELGARLREEVFEVGGSRPVDESIRAFLGRDWTLDAFFEELLGSEQPPQQPLLPALPAVHAGRGYCLDPSESKH
jgi:thimet oligopeptidase